MPMMSSAQVNSGNMMKLENLIFDAKILSGFIHKYFKEFSPVEEADRFEGDYLLGDHPFFMYKLNREIFSTSTLYTLMEIPVSHMYAYVLDKNRFALYFTAYLNKSTINKMINLIGPPINLIEEELAHPESSPLLNWMLDDVDILISRPTFGSYRTRWNVHVCTYNVNHNEFIRL